MLARGIERLAVLLGSHFEVAPLQGVRDSDLLVDGLYAVRGRSPSAADARIVIEAKATLTPAEARDIVVPRAILLKKLHDAAAVVVLAPWLSPRTRAVLTAHEISYLDLTGNIDFQLPTGVLIRTDGARRDPAPTLAARPTRGLSGTAAGLVARLLVDYSPPLRQKDIAVVAQVSPGYVSRLMQNLENEALITRTDTHITSVKWIEVVRARASTSTLMGKDPYRAVTTQGPDKLFDRLVNDGVDADVAITGSYAARTVSPLAVGGQLMLYVRPGAGWTDVATKLDLLPAAGGRSNVILIEAPNTAPFDRTDPLGKVQRVALSQLAIDCLSGPDRMPAEGEAVLSFMTETVDADVWRRPPGLLAEESAALS